MQGKEDRQHYVSHQTNCHSGQLELNPLDENVKHKPNVISYEGSGSWGITL